MQEQSDGRGWCLATYTGTYSAWVERAANVIASHTGRTGAIIGTIQSQSAASSLCRGAWVYDAARKRTSRALEAAGFAEAVSVESGLDVLVSLVRDADGDAGLSITLSVDGQPAADVVRALELAMIAGRGEVEISAACRRRDEQQVVSWRCALVEWSIPLSMDRVVDKLIGLLTFCIAGGRHTEPARRGIAPSSLGPTGR